MMSWPRNPEFRRQIHLELTSHRLILMPLVLGLLFGLAWLNGSSSEGWRSVGTVSVVLFGLLAMLWGTRQSADAVCAEVNDGTWDFQRMTGLGSWELTLGKLFGSTVFPWYGAAWCIPVYAVAHWMAPEAGRGFPLLAGVALTALLAQAVGLGVSLTGVRRWTGRGKVHSGSGFMAGIALGGIGLSTTIGLINDWRPGVAPWYGMEVPTPLMVLGSLAFFAAWAMVGCERMIRRELGKENTPVVWLIFVASVAAYQSGFSLSAGDMSMGDRALVTLYLNFVLVLSLAWLLVCVEPKDVVVVRRLAALIREGKFSGAWAACPLWPVTLVLSFLAVLPIFFMDMAGMRVADGEILHPSAFAAALLAFLVRDIAIFWLANRKGPSVRADATALVYLTILYFLIPLALKSMDAEPVFPLFLPMPDAGLSGCVPPVLQAAILWVLVVRWWRRGAA